MDRLIKHKHLAALNKMAADLWEWVFDNTDGHHHHLARTSVNCKLSFGFETGVLGELRYRPKVPLLTITYPNSSERTLIRFTTEKIKYPLSETTWARLMDGYDLFVMEQDWEKKALYD